MSNDELTLPHQEENFLSNHRKEKYKEIVARMTENYKGLEMLINLILHYLDLHIDYFPTNLGDY